MLGLFTFLSSKQDVTYSVEFLVSGALKQFAFDFFWGSLDLSFVCKMDLWNFEIIYIAAQIRYILESEEIRRAMEPLELIKRVCTYNKLQFIDCTITYLSADSMICDISCTFSCK